MNIHNNIKQTEFATLVGVSDKTVSTLLSEGVLTAKASGQQWLLEYCGRLREQAAGRAATGDLDLASERARLAREQADKIAMQNEEKRRALAPVHVIERTLASVSRQVASQMEAIEVELKRKTKLSADEITLVMTVVVKARNAMADIQPEWDWVLDESSD